VRWSLDRSTIALIGAALALAVLLMFATAPGVLTYDSVAQWRQALSGEYTDWHPPIMAAGWSLLNPHGVGPRGLHALQVALYVGAFLAVALALQRARWWILASALLPFTLNFSFVLWKDVWMAIALGFAVACLIASVRRKVWLAPALLLLGMALLLRANALFAVVPLMAWWLHLAGVTRLWLALIAAMPAAAVLLLSASALLTAIVKPEPTYPSQFIMVDDLFWLSGDRMRLPDYVGADPAQLKAGVQRCRDTALYLCPGLKFRRWITTDKGEYNQLRRAWRGAIFEDPWAYAQRRWQTFALLLRAPNQPPHEALVVDTYRPNPTGLRFEPNALGRALVGYLRFSIDGLPELFKPYLWLAFGLAALVLAWQRRAPIALALSGSAVGYVLGYALASQAADFRYVYWSVWATVWAWLALLARLEETP
jgi:hypothetical protein